MISILAQERLLGAALGTVFVGAVVFEERRNIYKTIAENQPHLVQKSQMEDHKVGKRPRFELAHLWNKAVDQTLGPVVEALSSRRW